MAALRLEVLAQFHQRVGRVPGCPAQCQVFGLCRRCGADGERRGCGQCERAFHSETPPKSDVAASSQRLGSEIFLGDARASEQEKSEARASNTLHAAGILRKLEQF